VARQVPATVDAEDAGTWLPARLAEPAAGRTAVVFHSSMWQYLPRPTRRGLVDAIAGAAARATDEAPLAWLSVEPGRDPEEAAEVRLGAWPGDDVADATPGGRALLALSGYHGRPVRRAGAGPGA
jgi:hypothetical protein